jgi:hypothetical protein
MTVGGLRLGGWAAVDYIPARGVLAGALGGAILSAALRLNSNNAAAKTAAVFGITTALVCASRLWLTHGEVSGLMAMAFSTVATLLCLNAAPSITIAAPRPSHFCTTAAAYLIALVGGAIIGFTRTDTLGDVYWPDIPLMFGAALSIGLLAAASLDKFGLWAKSAVVAVITLAVIIPLGITVAHLLPVIGITVLGAFAVALPIGLVHRSAHKDLPISLGFILLIAGETVAFSLLSGYGLALFALGAITIAAIAIASGKAAPISWIAFVVLLLVYRMEVLQNGTSVHSVGPADLWDLLAIGIGILLPRIVTSWMSDYTPKASWSTALQWLLAVSAPTLVLDYIWQPRSLTGLFLGLAIGQLAAARTEPQQTSDISALTSLLASLLLFLFLPGLDQFTGPTRTARIVWIIVLAGIAAIRILVHRSHPAAAAAKAA